jgi:thioredoxin reductase (NADPH)
VTYFNKLATVLEDKTIQLTGHNGEHEYVRAKNILIAVGGRPINLENIPKELTITSDDIFSLKKAPGKTLIVGASYVALECGGFLNGLGFDTTIMVRSILLRGFD